MLGGLGAYLRKMYTKVTNSGLTDIITISGNRPVTQSFLSATALQTEMAVALSKVENLELLITPIRKLRAGRFGLN